MHQATENNITNIIQGISALCLYIFAIYSNIVFLYINKAYSDSQPVSVILVFIVELIGLIGLFRAQFEFINSQIKMDNFICGSIILLIVIYAARINAYIVAYNFISSNTDNIKNYEALYINLIISTVLHSISAFINLIISFVIKYYINKEKKTKTIQIEKNNESVETNERLETV
jgi:hypothetical protein